MQSAVAIDTPNPIDLLFADMDKLGPGDDDITRYILRSLPEHRFEVVVDAGCGAGRQTLVLAKELNTRIEAVDSYQPFLDRLRVRAEKEAVAHLVREHCIDMKDIPDSFPAIDLLWSEGAAYNIGFADALKTWAKAIKPGEFAVVSELCWRRSEEIPNAVWEFFQTGYPDMRTPPQNIEIAEAAGYKIFNTYALPTEAWIKDYYEILEPRAKALIEHPDCSVRNFAAETIKEIETLGISDNSYAYIFYVLQRLS